MNLFGVPDTLDGLNSVANLAARSVTPRAASALRADARRDWDDLAAAFPRRWGSTSGTAVTHVSRGFGGATIDLGPWSDVEAGITAAVSDIADDVAGLSWAGRPEVKIVRSTGRSWDDYIETATLVETRTVGG